MSHTLTKLGARALLRVGVACRIRGLLLQERAFIRSTYGVRIGTSAWDILRDPSACEAPLRIARFLDPRKPTYLIDVGANNGDWAKRFVHLFRDTRLELWEPNPDLVRELRARFADNDTVSVVEAAASTGNGFAEFVVPAANAMGSLHQYNTVVSANVAHGLPAVRSVRLKPLDEFARDITNRQVVLKIDVQGHEGEVLKGAKEVLRHVDAVISETTVLTIYKGRPATFSRVVRALEEVGLYACMFPSAGVIAGNHPCEQDVLFVRESLLEKLIA